MNGYKVNMMHRGKAGLVVAVLGIGSLIPVAVWALPQGGTVSSGSATISTPTVTKMQIDQTTNLVVLDWRSFNIAGSEWVNFSQPSAASVALNRVAGQEPSAIYGSLTANGQIFLINPSGILFGSGSRVDVGALTVSTLNITNQDFLAGNYRFSQVPGYPNAAVINQGTITAGSGGFVALLGAAVHNEGVIQAQLGSVVLASGKAATLDVRGDGLIDFLVTAPVSGPVTGPNGVSLTSYVSNTGTLQADGGTIMLTAQAAVDVIQSVVNQTGIIRARTMNEHTGEIVFSGGDQGIVSISGALDASGTQPGQIGGTVQVTGDKVGLFGATINASGDAGGGTVLVGGDLHGANPAIQNASRTYVSADSTISANALTNGNGGQVVVWSNDGTQFYGSISARGGAQGGDGGFVEVSGEHYLDFRGTVDTRAPYGTTGMLLLDPDDATIDNSANSNVTNGAGTFTATAAGTAFTVTWATLDGQLATTNTTVQTTTGNITIGAAGALTNGNTLFLTAGGAGAINLNSSISSTAATNYMFTGPGGINLGANLTTAGGNVTFNNATTLTATSTVATNNGTITFGSTVDGTTAGAENLTLNSGTGSDFVLTQKMGGTTRLGAVTISARNIGFNVGAGTALTASNVSLTATDSTTVTNGMVTSSGAATIDIDTSAANGPVAVMGNSIGTDPNPLIVKPGTGTMSFKATGTATGNEDIFIDYSDGNLLISRLTLGAAGSSITIRTLNGGITFDDTANFLSNTTNDTFNFITTGGGIAFTGGVLTGANVNLTVLSGGGITSTVTAFSVIDVSGTVTLTVPPGTQIGSIGNPLLISFGTLSCGAGPCDKDEGFFVNQGFQLLTTNVNSSLSGIQGALLTEPIRGTLGNPEVLEITTGGTLPTTVLSAGQNYERVKGRGLGEGKAETEMLIAPEGPGSGDEILIK